MGRARTQPAPFRDLRDWSRTPLSLNRFRPASPKDHRSSLVDFLSLPDSPFEFGEAHSEYTLVLFEVRALQARVDNSTPGRMSADPHCRTSAEEWSTRPRLAFSHSPMPLFAGNVPNLSPPAGSSARYSPPSSLSTVEEVDARPTHAAPKLRAPLLWTEMSGTPKAPAGASRFFGRNDHQCDLTVR